MAPSASKLTGMAKIIKDLHKKTQKDKDEMDLQEILEYFEANPNAMQTCLLLCRDDTLLKISNEDFRPVIPASATKCSLVSLKVLKKSLVRVAPEKFPRVVLKKTTGKVVRKLFYRASGCTGKTKVEEHDEECWLDEMEARHKALDEPLKAMEVDHTATGESMFKFGDQGPFVFSDGNKKRVHSEGDRSLITHVMHIVSKTEVPLPKVVIDNIQDVVLLSNYSYETSTVSIEELHMHIPTKELFVKAGHTDIFEHQADFDQAIGKAAVEKAKEAAAKRNGTTSSSSSSSSGRQRQPPSMKKAKARFSARRVITGKKK